MGLQWIIDKQETNELSDLSNGEWRVDPSSLDSFVDYLCTSLFENSNLDSSRIQIGWKEIRMEGI